MRLSVMFSPTAPPLWYPQQIRSPRDEVVMMMINEEKDIFE
jgi:hypothetical protein